ncbi:MAG: FmdB family transcriptional regulator [Ignavibacteria bacterium]|nr:MAG: FmdB family transcriptional regulator [Ignavibacteria bacterium]
MPTYDYACKECNHRFEAFQSMKDPVLTTCPSCGAETLQRMIGAGAGLLFKGSGYYLTDYKKSSASPSNGNGTNGDSTDAKAATETSSAAAKPAAAGAKDSSNTTA